MDDRRFDNLARTVAGGGWSRRAALRSAGGALGALLARLGPDEAAAACATHGKPCQGNGGCCSGFCERNGRCKKQGELTGNCHCRCPRGTTRCGSKRCCGAGQRCQGGRCAPDCLPAGSPCASFAGCCSRSCDFRVEGGTCSPCRGQGCASSRDCCGGVACQNSYCGGCRDRAVVCADDSDCCFSDCGNYDGTNVCLSDFGGRCARDVDCGGCYLSGYCDGACVDGRCTV